MYKSEEFMARLAFVGEGVQVFAQALLLKPEAISLGDRTRIDDFTRIEGGSGVEVGRHVHISSFCSIFAGGAAKLGDYSCMAQGSRILTGSERLDAAMSSVAPNEWRQVDTGTSIVDHLAFMGANSVAMPGVSLAVGAVLGAGGVATCVHSGVGGVGRRARAARLGARPRAAACARRTRRRADGASAGRSLTARPGRREQTGPLVPSSHVSALVDRRSALPSRSGLGIDASRATRQPPAPRGAAALQGIGAWHSLVVPAAVAHGRRLLASLQRALALHDDRALSRSSYSVVSRSSRSSSRLS